MIRRQKHWKTFALMAALSLLGLGLFFCSVAFGSVSIPFDVSLRAILGMDNDSTVLAEIVREVRIPKAFTAALAGGALAMAGLMMQTVFRNPLADPFVLGINSGASLGVALLILTLGTGVARFSAFEGIGANIGVTAAAALGASLVMVVIFALSRKVDAMTLLIIGLMLSYATSAFTSILIYLSVPERVQAYISWTFGDFVNVSPDELLAFGPAVLVGCVIGAVLIKPLNALLLGEEYARSLGVSAFRVRFILLASASLLAGSVTAFCGPIGFVGIAVPHLCRGIFRTSEHAILMPACIILGACVTLFADLVAQLPGSRLLLPLNSVTALIGAPVIIFVLLKRKDIRGGF